jgi:hypothetical protein
VWVEDHFNLHQLHHVIQAAMGWTDAHLHQFQIGKIRYRVPHPEDDPDDIIVDERQVGLSDVLSVGLRFEYMYDFGDDWQHLIHVDQAVPLDQRHGAAWVEAGARACPPEDSGGRAGYQEFLDAFAGNPRRKEVLSFLKWAGEDFHPDRFDRYATNAALLRMAWNRWGEK